MTTAPVVYLHGFASGPGSKKARFFGGRFAGRGLPFAVPDLAAGDFSRLTISRQLEVVERAIAGRVVCLMGSSLGGYLAALYAAAHPAQVERLVLMAPAFDFASRWRLRLGETAFEEWERTGRLSVFHYGAGEPATVGFDLYSDALQHPPFPAVTQPTLIFHGTSDNVVPVELSEHFAAGRETHVRLRRFDSDHELVDVTDPMWEATWAFLQD